MILHSLRKRIHSFLLWKIFLAFVLMGCSSQQVLPSDATPSPLAVERYEEGRALVFDDKNYEQAIAPLNEAIRLHPGYAHAYYARGTAYYNLKEYFRALADHDRAIQLEPDFVAAYYARGVAHLTLGHNEQAIKDLERFLSESTDPYWRKQAEDVLRILQEDDK